MREFLISVASGFAVAVLSAIFIGRSGESGGKPGQTQSMSMTTNKGGGFAQTLLIFFAGAAIAFAVLMYAEGRLVFQ